MQIQKVVNQKQDGFDQENKDRNQKQMLHFDGEFGHIAAFWMR